MKRNRISGEVTQKVLDLLKERGSLRSRDLAEMGISREMLRYSPRDSYSVCVCMRLYEKEGITSDGLG